LCPKTASSTAVVPASASARRSGRSSGRPRTSESRDDESRPPRPAVAVRLVRSRRAARQSRRAAVRGLRRDPARGLGSGTADPAAKRNARGVGGQPIRWVRYCAGRGSEARAPAGAWAVDSRRCKAPPAGALARRGRRSQRPGLVVTGAVNPRGRPRVTSEARAALAGIGIASLLMGGAAIRFMPTGAGATSLASATTNARSLPTFWVVRAGQTLAVVSATTGVSLAAIEQLNPHADPGALRPGQRIRLRAAP
jgi:hypothetical protein